MSSQRHGCNCIFSQSPVNWFTKNCECSVKLKYIFLLRFLFIAAWISEPWIPSRAVANWRQHWIFDANSKNQSGLKLLWGNYMGGPTKISHYIIIIQKKIILCTIEQNKISEMSLSLTLFLLFNMYVFCCCLLNVSHCLTQ